METATVTIVGAGPAGLVLGLALAQQGIRSIILEKELEVTQDPRGVYLAADAVRALYAVGLEKYMPIIGHEPHQVQFHQSSYTQAPFHTIDLTHDKLLQVAPNGVLQIQPELEKSLRAEVVKSGLCELRLGCHVQRLEELDDGVSVQYKDSTGSQKQLETRWLVGADGKRGVVRKTFLEPVADIRQVDATYRYEGTWVASNLKLRKPTPETHPDFPLWKLGMKPTEVYDLFWPKGWHFCSPPGKPTAGGRFGPFESGYWRHEFRQSDWNAQTMNAEELFWEHITPMITRSAGQDNVPWPCGSVTYPRDCIEIVRCQPFTFAHKIVNRWYSRRTVLIGDAAHVFPPFGGQGIASGVRDAHQLAWRIAFIERVPDITVKTRERILDSWARERTQSVADAAELTRINGLLANTYFPPLVWFFWFLHSVIKLIASPLLSYDPQVTKEPRGFSNVLGGSFLLQHQGGMKIPQVYVNTLFDKRVLSDTLLASKDSIFKLLVLVPDGIEPATKISDLEAELKAAGVPERILSASSATILSVSPARPDSLGHYSENHADKAAPLPETQLPQRVARSGYNVHAFRDRFGPRARFIIARPDAYVFAVAKDLKELRRCFEGLKKACGEGFR